MPTIGPVFLAKPPPLEIRTAETTNNAEISGPCIVREHASYLADIYVRDRTKARVISVIMVCDVHGHGPTELVY